MNGRSPPNERGPYAPPPARGGGESCEWPGRPSRYDRRPLHLYGTTSQRKTLDATDAGPASLVYVHGLDEPRAATLTFFVNKAATNGAAVLVTIDTLSFNGATFRRYVYLAPAFVERRVRLTGTGFIVSAQLTTQNHVVAPTTLAAIPAPPAGATCELSVALNDTDDHPQGDLVPIWDTTPVAVGATENRYQGPGTLLQASFTLANLGGSAALWLFVYDNRSAAAAQAAGQAPIIPPPMLTAVGQNADFSGIVRPGALFANGLSWLLSTTQSPASAPAAGAIGRFDWLGGY